MNKIITFLLLFTILSSCSLDTKSGIWTENNKITKKKIDNPIIKEKKNSKTELVKKEKNLNNEYNSNLILKLSEVELRNNSLGNLTNNNKKSNFDNPIKNISKYKFSKIKNFNYYEPEIAFEKKNVIFFENNGNILKFNNLSKLVWEKNHYTKIEKKSKPMLYLAANDKKLIVADNLAKYYALDIKTGNLLWSKSNSAPFNSQIKIHKDKILVIDFNDVLKGLLDENAILVINKSDLLKKNLSPEFKNINHVLISVKDNLNIDSLVSKIKNKLKNKFIASDDILITRERHRQHLEQSLNYLQNFEEKNQAEDFDKAAEDLRLAAKHLGMIVGKVDVEEILGSIFNDFCIGK